MRLSFELNGFICPESIRSHLEQVFEGEYDIPLHGMGMRVLDLGANCGAFSIWASHRWPNCQITAYEPHPKTFDILTKNMKNYPNVTCINKGVGEAGWKILHDGKNNCGEMSLERNLTTRSTGVHVEIIDAFELPPAEFIKLDIEGSEYHVLPKLIESGRKFSAIMYEYHNEEIRRKIDGLLEDYQLVSSKVSGLMGRGTACYIHKEHL